LTLLFKYAIYIIKIQLNNGGRTGEGFFLDIILGIVGAVAGGWLFSLFGMHGVTGLNIYSLVVAVVGAVILMVLYHAVRGRAHA
jgi:uncharacterized membrane protein YeaQ/YmgE (transglycosylase-associated protein family)